jgi:DNA-binding transcriptional MerR regulator
MRIGELAEQAGLSTKAIRYYEQIGILTPAARTTSGYRTYDETALGRLGFVRAAEALGLPLGEIRQIIAFRDDDTAPCTHVTATASPGRRPRAPHRRAGRAAPQPRAAHRGRHHPRRPAARRGPTRRHGGTTRPQR